MNLRRGALTDYYVEGDRSVAMVHESVLGLSPIATAILEAVPKGAVVSLKAVADHVVDTFGPPAGPTSAEDLTRQQVWDLVAHNVLVVIDDEDFWGRAPRLHHEHAAGDTDGGSAAAVGALREVLRHLRSGDPRPWTAPEAVSSAGLVAAARQHHVIPYVAAHLERLDLPAQARAELEAAAGRQRAGAAVLVTELARALEVLGAAGVRALAFKGVTLAAQSHGDFGIRGAGDLDLLVAPRDLALAHQALAAADWAPAQGYPLPGPSWAWRHFVRTGNELTLAGSKSEIDLHWHLVPTHETFPDFDTLWSRREVVNVNGLPLPTFSRYDALAHSAGHAAKDGWRWLRSLLDVHALAADARTWVEVDRPLRRDQLLSVGLCARELGVPPGAPAIVSLAADAISPTVLDKVRNEQNGTASAHRPAVSGLNFLNRLRSIKLTRGSAAEAGRLLSRSALPPWHTADQQSSSALHAVPRALLGRCRELGIKLLSRT